MFCHYNIVIDMPVIKRARAIIVMIIICGPFCVGCSQLLHIEPCRQCARAQWPGYAGRVFEAIEMCVRQGDIYCENGIALRARAIPSTLTPKDVKTLASILAPRHPSGILVFHLARRVCCRIKHGATPVLVDVAGTVGSLMSSLVLVVIGGAGGMAVLDISGA